MRIERKSEKKREKRKERKRVYFTSPQFFGFANSLSSLSSEILFEKKLFDILFSVSILQKNKTENTHLLNNKQ